MSEPVAPVSPRAAAARFVRNRAALFALLTLILIAIVSWLGPSVDPLKF